MHLREDMCPKTVKPDFSMTLLDPVGAITKSSGTMASANTFRFSTKPFEPEVGIGWWGYRWYSPNQQRWLSRDPIGDVGAVVPEVVNAPQAYDFVGNNATLGVDPYGLRKGVYIAKVIVPDQCLTLDGYVLGWAWGCDSSGAYIDKPVIKAPCERTESLVPPDCYFIHVQDFYVGVEVCISRMTKTKANAFRPEHRALIRSHENYHIQGYAKWYAEHANDFRVGFFETKDQCEGKRESILEAVNDSYASMMVDEAAANPAAGQHSLFRWKAWYDANPGWYETMKYASDN